MNPITKLVDDEDDDIFKIIMRAYTEGYNADSEEEDEPELPRVTLEEALYSLATLRLYKEQVEYRSREVVRVLDKRERDLLGHKKGK